jgi:streptogramin lyase
MQTLKSLLRRGKRCSYRRSLSRSSQGSRLWLEALEDRTLLAGSTLTTVETLANPSVFGQSVTLRATVRPSILPAGSPTGTVTFTENNTPLGTADLSTAAPSVDEEFPTQIVEDDPSQIAVGPDANLWFIRPVSNLIGRITTSGRVSEFLILPRLSQPEGITAGPDGNLWFTDGLSNEIGQITTSGTVSEFSIPTSFSDPHGITAGPDGNLWFTESLTDKIGQITTSGAVSEFNIPTAHSEPGAIAAGPDGNLWFTESLTNKIGQITTSGTVSEFNIPSLNGGPVSIAAGPDGNLWFTESASNQIGRITTSGTISEFSIPTSGSSPAGITAGPDGNLWFTEEMTGKIGRVHLSPATATLTANLLPAGTDSITAMYGGDSNFGASTSPPVSQSVYQASALTTLTSSANPSAFGQMVTFTATVSAVAPGAGLPGRTVTLFENGTAIGTRTLTGNLVDEFPTPTGNSHPYQIATGADDSLWFTENLINKIGRISTSGTVTEFSIPAANSAPGGITAGPDGNLWFTESGANHIGRISTSGTVSEFSIPTSSSLPLLITAGPDGNLWFTEEVANKIGRITTAGVVTEFTVPTPNSLPAGIAAGPDGNLWFTELHANKIGQISSSGTVTEFSIPTSSSSPFGITAGPDGNLWFTEGNGNNIGRITTSGTVSEFSIALSPNGITAGPDGNLWFTESQADQIGRITTSGIVSEFPIPTASSNPFGIASGPDGNLWFTEDAKIGRVHLRPATATFTTDSLPPGMVLMTATYSGDTNFNSSTSMATTQTVIRAINLSSISVPTSTVGVAYSQTVVASGGAGTVTLSVNITSGAVPPGMTITVDSLHANQLDINGTPTAAGSVIFSVTASDSIGTTTAQSYTLTARTARVPANLLAAAQLITHSQEHYVDLVTNLYLKYLRRAADVSGLGGWVGALFLGQMTDDQVTADFLISNEYVNNHGGFVLSTSPCGSYPGQAWIVGLYNDVLGRAPAPVEIQGWLGAMQNNCHQWTPFNVAFTFVGGPEKETAEIMDAYMTFLGRAPSATEINNWLGAFLNGVTPGVTFTIEDLRGYFVGSTEYYLRSVKGNGNNADWVRSAYFDILGRAASDHEVNDIWLPILNQGP